MATWAGNHADYPEEREYEVCGIAFTLCICELLVPNSSPRQGGTNILLAVNQSNKEVEPDRSYHR
jgi:hypothetical protein